MIIKNQSELDRAMDNFLDNPKVYSHTFREALWALKSDVEVKIFFKAEEVNEYGAPLHIMIGDKESLLTNQDIEHREIGLYMYELSTIALNGNY